MKQTLRESLRDRMTKSGVSISALARAAGVSRPNLSDYLAGKQDFTGETLDRLFAAMATRVPCTKNANR